MIAAELEPSPGRSSVEIAGTLSRTVVPSPGGLDYGVTLAIVLPGDWRHQLERKSAKLRQYGRRVFGVDDAVAAVDRPEAFFRSVGAPTREKLVQEACPTS